MQSRSVHVIMYDIFILEYLYWIKIEFNVACEFVTVYLFIY